MIIASHADSNWGTGRLRLFSTLVPVFFHPFRCRLLFHVSARTRSFTVRLTIHPDEDSHQGVLDVLDRHFRFWI